MDAIKAAKAANATPEAPLSEGAAGAASAPGANNAEVPHAFPMPPLTMPGADRAAGGIELLGDVDLHVKIELGRTKMLVEDVLRLSEGSVVELDKLAGDPVDVYVNDRPVARGEVLVLNDNFCVRINEILSDTPAAKR
jgi:flagellar motor switch protein FliN/FliY